MTHIDQGTQGAKRQSWHHGPRELLMQIINEIGATDRKALLAEFTDRVLTADNIAIQETIIEYWFSNNLNSLLVRHSSSSPEARASERRERTEQTRKAIVHRVKLAASQVLLDWKLPHGKKLRDSTGAECRLFGGWLDAVSGQMKPEQVVGSVFTEKQLRRIFAETET